MTFSPFAVIFNSVSRPVLLQCWAVLSSVEQCWAVLSSVEQCWAVLSSVEQCWAVLSSVEQCWAKFFPDFVLSVNMCPFPSLAPPPAFVPSHSRGNSQSGGLSHSRSSSRSSLDELLTSQPRPRELNSGVKQKMLLDYSVYMAQYVPPEPATPTAPATPANSPVHSAESSPGASKKVLRGLGGGRLYHRMEGVLGMRWGVRVYHRMQIDVFAQLLAFPSSYLAAPGKRQSQLPGSTPCWAGSSGTSWGRSTGPAWCPRRSRWSSVRSRWVFKLGPSVSTLLSVYLWRPPHYSDQSNFDISKWTCTLSWSPQTESGSLQGFFLHAMVASVLLCGGFDQVKLIHFVNWPL